MNTPTTKIKSDKANEGKEVSHLFEILFFIPIATFLHGEEICEHI